MILKTLCIMVVLALAWAAPVAAKAGKPLLGQVVYYEPKDTYFALVDAQEAIGHVRRWDVVKNYVEQLTYEGRRARMAVIDSADVHNFLINTFNPVGPTWIGLRVFCIGSLVPVWVTGKRLKPGDFTIWAQQWNVEAAIRGLRTNCIHWPRPYYPVFYSVREGFRWQAQGPKKHYSYVFVEYPKPENYFE